MNGDKRAGDREASSGLLWFRVGVPMNGPAAQHLGAIGRASGSKRRQADNLYGALKSDTSSFVIVRE